jgi:hypothetical protein
VTIISGLLIAILVLSELSAYRTSVMKPELVIDKGRKDKLPITFNVTFPKIPCYCKFDGLHKATDDFIFNVFMVCSA